MLQFAPLNVPISTDNTAAYVVLVEDSHAITDFLQRTLLSAGHTVSHTYDNTDDALAYFKQHSADLLILDIHTWGQFDALEAARRIRQTSQVPVVLIADGEDPQQLQAARDLNPQGILLKPFTQRDLTTVVDLALANHKAEGKLRDSDTLYRLLTRYGQEMIWVRDLDGRCLYVSPSVQRLLGYSDEQFAALPYDATVTRDTLLPHTAAIQKMVKAAGASDAPHPPVISDITMVHKTGQFLPVRDTVHILRNADGQVSGVVGVATENVENSQLKKALAQARQRFELTLSSTRAAIWDWNILENEVYFSPQCLKMLGYDDHQLPQSWDTWSQIVVPSDYASFVDALSGHMIDPRQAFSHELRMQHADGSTLWIHIEAHCLADERGTVSRMVGVLRDVTGEKATQPVTGLPGDAYFEERLQAAINRHHTDRRSLYAILTVSIDSVPQITATYGEQIRDYLLRQCSSKLQQTLGLWHKQQGISGTLAATTDSRFRILLESLSDFERVPVLAQRLGQDCMGPTDVQGQSINWTISSGVFLGIQTVNHARDAMRGSDSALRIGQMRSPRCVEVFNVEMRSEVLQRLRLTADLAEAIHRNELSVAYQPIYYLQNQKFAGFEALLRWQHPQLGPISPVVFIPIAESAGLMPEIGLWVLRESFQQLHTWMQAGLMSTNTFISANVSPLQLADADFVSRVAGVLAGSGAHARQIKLEVTESALMSDVNRSRLMLRQLHDLGFQLSIDDFGTGYSSLSYLQEFSMDYLKIERMFVSRLTDGTDASDPSTILLRSIIGLSNNLGLQSIAEGIETPHQLAVLTALGCDFGQGFYWSRPLPTAEAAEYLRRLKA